MGVRGNLLLFSHAMIVRGRGMRGKWWEFGGKVHGVWWSGPALIIQQSLVVISSVVHDVEVAHLIFAIRTARTREKYIMLGLGNFADAKNLKNGTKLHKCHIYIQ